MPTTNDVQQFQEEIERLRLRVAREEHLAASELKQDTKFDNLPKTKADGLQGHFASEKDQPLAKPQSKITPRASTVDKRKPLEATQHARTPRDNAKGRLPGLRFIHPEVENGFEQDIQARLLAKTKSDLDEAKDLLAHMLTTSHGELLLGIGSNPPRDKFFIGELLDGTMGWVGTERTNAEVELFKEVLERVVDELGGEMAVLFEAYDEHPRAYFLIRLPPPDVSAVAEVRCAIVGNVDSGKSTTLGVLTRGGLDDGRGLARVVLFRHKHEIETGRTSSVGMEILGFDTKSRPVLPDRRESKDPDALRREKLSWDEISARSTKIITFIDLAGHERYLKTTLYGLTSGAPSCVILMVGANAGIIGMSKEHLAISIALNIPICVCITKIDMTPKNILEETIKQVDKLLRSPGCRKTPVYVESTELAIAISRAFMKEKIAPIFQISNVTGQGIQNLRTFLNLLPSSEDDREKFDTSKPLEFSITEVWSVPYVGTVVNGIVNSGAIKTGDAILVGPDSNGQYLPTIVKSMQRKKADVLSAEAGQTVALALKRVRRVAVRKGMIAVHKVDTPPRAIRRFEGQVLILYHNTTMQPNYQAMLHCGAVRQTVRILSIDHPQGLLRTGDRATVQFEFISRPEFIKKGMKLLFREGKTKGLGVVTGVF